MFTTEDLTSVPQMQDMDCECGYLSDIVVDDDIVLKKLNKLRHDKAPGPDNIQPRFLKEIGDLICHPLAVIFRRSLEEGIVPDDWRFANVSPIYKKGSRSQVSNYCPVSLTSQVCKVFEAIIHDDIMEHLLINKLVRSSQHGFLWGRSCLSN